MSSCQLNVSFWIRFKVETELKPDFKDERTTVCEAFTSRKKSKKNSGFVGAAVFLPVKEAL